MKMLSIISGFILIYVMLSLIGILSKRKSIYDGEIEQKNSMENKKVKFIFDDKDDKNADGTRGHLEEIGISDYKNSVYDKYTKRVIDSIRIKRADISWVGIKICGTNAVIEVVEADEIPDVIDSNDYCNIVAKKDAMVVDASAQNGTLQVKEGDVVKKGTVLVAGWMEGKYTGTRYVHATGDVVGKVWYSANKRVYYHQSVEKRTGKLEKKHSLNINNFAINFYKRLSKFEIYDTIGTEKKFKISSNFYLPIKFITKENYELIKEEKVYTKEEAKEIGVNELTNELNQQIQDEKSIINKYISTNENEDYIEVEVIYEVLESIGTEEKIAL